MVGLARAKVVGGNRSGNFSRQRFSRGGPGAWRPQSRRSVADFTTTTENGLTVPTMMVVDTPGNAAWIHEGNTWTHQETKDRGRGLDRREYETLSSSIASMDRCGV